VPIVDDLQRIAERTKGDLNSVHDFFEDSKTAWESFEFNVSLGRTVTLLNPATGTLIDQAGLLALVPKYTYEYLATFTFRQFVSIFESFFFAFFLRIIQHNPRQYAKSKLELDIVLKAKDRVEIISNVLLKQLNDLKYENIRDWFAALNNAVKLGCPTEDEADSLAEIKTTRDILEHSGGVVNDIYIRKTGKKARYPVGVRIGIDDAYHLASWRLIKKVVADLTMAATTKLAWKMS
jgi:hypothetical protein